MLMLRGTFMIDSFLGVSRGIKKRPKILTYDLVATIKIYENILLLW